MVDVLTENVKCPESITLEGKSALLIDGFALVATVRKPDKAKTFGDFAYLFYLAKVSHNVI